MVENRNRYEDLGVREYYWFDPDTLNLKALLLDEATGKYRERAPDAFGRYPSLALGVEVGIENDRIGLFKDGVYIKPLEELYDQAEAEREQAEAERKRAWAELEKERRRREELEARLRDLESRQD